MKNIFNRFWLWLKGLFVRSESKKTIVEVPYQPVFESNRNVFKKTKNYVDQRQKMPKNRKRHPSKRTRNIYKTMDR